MKLRPHTTPVTVALLLAAALMLLGLAGSAQAVPPGGPSSDTEGTAGTASPRSLAPGGTIGFSISGFPAGETVSVKIDDGDFCSAKGVHGACVVHQQRVASDGTAKGSFALPSDLPEGDHWLRFLASEEIVDDEGRYLGVKPYSLRGDTDFTITAGAAQDPSAPAGTRKSPTEKGTPADPQAPATGVPGTDPATDTVTEGAADPATVASGPLVLPAPPGAASGDVRAPESAPLVEAAEQSSTSAEPVAEDGFPFVGAGVLVAAGAAAVVVARRRRTA